MSTNDRRLTALSVVCRTAGTDRFRCAEVSTMPFGHVVRELLALNQANFGSLVACSRSLRDAGEGHHRRYAVLKERLEATYPIAASFVGWTQIPPLSLSHCKRLLGHIEGRGAYGITALMRAVRGDNATVQQLIALGVDVNARSGRFFKTTALSEAITWDNLTAVKWLLAAKADVSQGGLLDELPIAAAARLGRQEMVKPLVAAKANVNSRGENQETPLHVASEHAHVATVAALLNQRADAQATTSSGETAIHKVVMGHYPVAGGCRVVVLRQLAAAGVPLEVRHGQYRFTALMEATFSGQTDLFLELQALGADLSVRNIAGASLLMIALWRNHLSTAHAILTARPDVHARARNGETALMIAAGAGHQTIVERLLEARAEVDAENDYGWTAWMVAYENGHRAVAQRLQKAGAIARFDDVREPTLWENATQWVGSCVACALRMARR